MFVCLFDSYSVAAALYPQLCPDAEGWQTADALPLLLEYLAGPSASSAGASGRRRRLDRLVRMVVASGGAYWLRSAGWYWPSQ